MTSGPAIGRSSQRGEGGDDEGLRIEPLRRERLGDALSLLASGRTGLPAEVAVRSTALGLGGDLDHLAHGMWMAWRGDRPVAAAGVVPAAGRTAMVFVSPPRDDNGRTTTCDDAATLLRMACAAETSRQVCLFQTLLSSPDGPQRRAVELAGFRFLAQLTYMQRRTLRQPVELALSDNLTVQTWRPALRDDFTVAIAASYEHTLDCPDLVGMRRVEDVLDGHLAVGEFRDDLWLLLREHGQPAGVMLLSLTDQRHAAELVYLGLRPSLRSRGLGRALLTHGLWRARRAGAEKMLLAVDERNAPALGLYQSLHFVPIARRTAMVMAAAP